MSWSGRKVTTARALWLPRLPLPCRRCGRPVTADQRWTVGHVVDRALGGAETDPGNQWPEHARCNYSAGGKLGAAMTNQRRRARVASSMSGEQSRGIRGV